MILASFVFDGRPAIGLKIESEILNLTAAGAPQTIDEVLNSGHDGLSRLKALSDKATVRMQESEINTWLPPISSPSKAVAIGLNYVDHATESKLEKPDYPHIFMRYPTSWVGHHSPLVRPKASKIFDYEGEMVVVIGKAGRAIQMDKALDHVAGYSIFNDGSLRDFQMRTPQWGMGKNFDKSGGFGPYFVTSDELPMGASGLQLQTKLNGEVLQDANTRDMIFDVATLICICSEVFELRPGDIIISGTPAGVGGMRNPPIFMKPGDVCEVSVEGIGTLSNSIVEEDEPATARTLETVST